jgi:2-hydroxymuconate-semialdehyde hydrolase
VGQEVDGRARDRVLEGLPVRRRRVDVDGVSTVVLEGGQGPTTLLLHGGIECGGAIWAPVIRPLAERSTLVVPDAPGLGESEPVPRLDPAAFAGWFAALIRLTCPDPPVVVAHSLLGTLAARFAAGHGDLLRGLVIYGTPGVGPYHLPAGLLVAAIRSDVRPSARNLDRFARWPFHDLDRARRKDPDWYAAFFAYLLSCSTVPHVKRTMRHLIRACTKRVPVDELRRIAVPTALLWGRHDRMVPLRVGEAARDALGWPLHVVDGTGHVPHAERTGAFLDALADATMRPGHARDRDG